MQLKTITVSVFLGLLIIVTGCDPVRTTRQTVSLQVLDLESEKQIRNVRIEIKYDFDKGELLSEETLQPKEKWHKHRRDSWKQEPWVVGVLENGVFKVSVEKTAIDRSRNSTPAKSRNTVTGKPFLVRITSNPKAETATEETSILMKQNELGKTESFKVVVLDVGEPIYIEVQEKDWNKKSTGDGSGAKN